MSRWQALVPKLAYLFLAAFLVTLAVRSHNETTVALVVCSLFMFAACWANATRLRGAKTAFAGPRHLIDEIGRLVCPT